VDAIRTPSAFIRRVWGSAVAEIDSAGTRNVAITLAGNLGRLTLGFVSSVIIARALGPAGYGVIALVSVVLAIADTVGDFGLTYTAVRSVARTSKKEPAYAGELAHGYLTLGLLASTATALLGVALAGPIARLLLDRADLAPYLRLAMVGLVTLAGSGFAAAMLQATYRFGRLAVAGVVSGATYLACIAGLAGLGHLSVGSVIAVGVVNPLVGFALGLALLPRGFVRLRGAFSRSAVRAWPELTAFGKWMWVSAMFSLLASHLDLLMLNHWSSPGVLGAYALAFNMSQKMDSVNQARFMVLVPTASALRTRQEMTEYLRRTSRRSVLLVAGFALAVPFMRPFIGAFYGAGFSDALWPLIVLAAVVAFDAVTAPFILLALPLDQPRALAASDAARVAVLAGAGWFLIPLLGPIGAALSRLASRVAGVAVVLPLIASRVRRIGDAGTL
jgi:O-antigen/teichoic acid export membrane protein